MGLLSLRCPKCGNRDVRRSKWRRNEAQGHLLSLPFRCEACGERFLAVPRHRVLVPGATMLLVVALVATAVGFYGYLDPPEHNPALLTNPMISAAESGDREAQYRLAIAYRDGTQHFDKDPLLAYKWFYAAALQGLPQAQYEVALLYKQGRGALQDFKEAFRWFERAAKADIPEAQYYLASAYMRGEGVPIDFRLAYAWYNRAASLGLASAASARDQAAMQMRPAELEQAQSMSYQLLQAGEAGPASKSAPGAPLGMAASAPPAGAPASRGAPQADAINAD